MNKLIPFKKDIIFENNIAEISSISLEHNLTHNDNLVEGNFNISGEYKITDTSVNTESFNYNLPFSTNVDAKYNLDNVKIDIDDFYYELVNDNVMRVNIEVLIDNLEEERCVEPEEVKTEDNYKSYTVYLVREGDTIESIMENYSVTKEELLEYNEVNEIKAGDKIIIPC